MGGGKKENSPQTDQLSSMARALFNQTAGLRKEYTNQSLEALKTGGITAQIPIIARALEHSRRAQSQSRQTTTDNLARTGLVGTPFGQSILAQQEITGNQQIADIPTNYAQSFINQIPNFVSTMTGQGIQGQGQASSNEVQLYGSYNNAYGQVMPTIISQGLGMAGKIAGAAAGGMMGGMGGGAMGGIGGGSKFFV